MSSAERQLDSRDADPEERHARPDGRGPGGVLAALLASNWVALDLLLPGSTPSTAHWGQPPLPDRTSRLVGGRTGLEGAVTWECLAFPNRSLWAA